MPQITSNRLRAAATSALLILLAGLLLAACGGGSSSNSSSSKSTSTSAKAARGAGRQFGARGAALRTCLQKNGITLPKVKAGQRRTPGAGGPFGASGAGGAGGAAKLPNGVTRAQFQAALKKCGGAQFGGGKGFAAGGAQRFAKFAACMRKNGVKLPQPNTSGKGPIFNTKGIDTTSASFKAADAKCVRELRPSGARPGGQGAPGAGAQGTPGAPGGAAPGEAPAGAPPSE
jgi:hypothetical protein